MCSISPVNFIGRSNCKTLLIVLIVGGLTLFSFVLYLALFIYFAISTANWNPSVT
jgi:hypothetical protein